MSSLPFVTRLACICFAATSAIVAVPSRAQLVEIQWDAGGIFERSLDIAPAKFVEVCGKLAKGQSIGWSFKGQQPMNFNIHYHEGKKVVFPIKKNDTTSMDGTLAVPVDQDYCWMWENKGSTPAPISLTLRRG
jgi:hypothetical protein